MSATNPETEDELIAAIDTRERWWAVCDAEESGFKAATSAIMRAAATAFTAGRDSEAESLRDLARMIERDGLPGFATRKRAYSDDIADFSARLDKLAAAPADTTEDKA